MKRWSLIAVLMLVCASVATHAQYTYSCPAGYIPICNNPTGNGCNGTVPQLDCAINTASTPYDTSGAAAAAQTAAIALIPTTSHQFSVPANCVAASANGTTYTCTTSPTFVPTTGDHIQFMADVANTASATLNVNAAGAKPIKKLGGSSNLVANDLLANHWISATYDGTNWQLEGQLGNSTPSATVAIAVGGTGTATAPSAAQIMVAQSATAYAPETMSSDCAIAATGAITCTKTSGTALGTFATANAVSPPAIGGTTPAAVSATVLKARTIGGSTAATVAAGAAISGTGTGYVAPACAASHVCSSNNGTVTFTTGSTAAVAGILLTVTDGTTHTNLPDCHATIALTASPYTQTTSNAFSYSTTVATLNVGVVLTASTSYTATYLCMGF